jgi:hypothetical protein
MNYIQLDGDTWHTVPSAAEFAGVKPVTVYKAVSRERLRSRNILGVIAVSESDMVELWGTDVREN